MKHINRGIIAGTITIGLLAGMTPLAMAQNPTPGRTETTASREADRPNPTPGNTPSSGTSSDSASNSGSNRPNPTPAPSSDEGSRNPIGEEREKEDPAKDEARVRDGGELAEGGLFIVGHKEKLLPAGKWTEGFSIASASKGAKGSFSFEGMEVTDSFQNKKDKTVQTLYKAQNEGTPNLITWEPIDASKIDNFEEKAKAFQEANRVPKKLRFWTITKTELVPNEEVEEYWEYLKWQSRKERVIKTYDQFQSQAKDVVTGKAAAKEFKRIWDHAKDNAATIKGENEDEGNKGKSNADKPNPTKGRSAPAPKDAPSGDNDDGPENVRYSVADKGIIYIGSKETSRADTLTSIPREAFRDGLVVAYDAPKDGKFESNWFDVAPNATTVKIYQGEEGRLIVVHRGGDSSVKTVTAWDRVEDPNTILGYEAHVRDTHGGSRVPEGSHVYKLSAMRFDIADQDVEKEVTSLKSIA